MAVQMQPKLILPDKFEKLRISRYVFEEAMSSPSTPTSPPPEPYEIKTITEKDSPQILDFLRRFFFKDEPLNVAVRLLDNQEQKCVELENMSKKEMNGLSLMAVTLSGNLIGVCLNAKLEEDDKKHEDDCKNPKFDQIMKILDFTGNEGTKIISQLYPDVDKVLLVKILSVDGAWRGKGIAQALMKRTRQICREQGYGLMRVDCTSYFSAKAIAKLGFDCVYELKYKDYTSEDGKPIFNTEHPHNSLTIYVQRISQCQSP